METKNYLMIPVCDEPKDVWYEEGIGPEFKSRLDYHKIKFLNTWPTRIVIVGGAHFGQHSLAYYGYNYINNKYGNFLETPVCFCGTSVESWSNCHELIIFLAKLINESKPKNFENIEYFYNYALIPRDEIESCAQILKNNNAVIGCTSFDSHAERLARTLKSFSLESILFTTYGVGNYPSESHRKKMIKLEKVFNLVNRLDPKGFSLLVRILRYTRLRKRGFRPSLRGVLKS